jgi:hypothetical protein
MKQIINTDIIAVIDPDLQNKLRVGTEVYIELQKKLERQLSKDPYKNIRDRVLDEIYR